MASFGRGSALRDNKNNNTIIKNLSGGGGEQRSVKMAHTTRYDTGCAYAAYSGLQEID